MNAFTVRSLAKIVSRIPVEDSFSHGKNFLAVADGITRDPSEVLPDLKTLVGKVKFAYGYPMPSPASLAAQRFTQSIETHFSYVHTGSLGGSVMRAIAAANTSIHRLNETLGLVDSDYLTRDLAGCVAAVAVRDDDYVHWGFVADCGVAIFDENGNLKFRTLNEGPRSIEDYSIDDERLDGAKWRNPETRRIIRAEYRNNPSNPQSYGALTGERVATRFVREGVQEFAPGDHLVVYTDGLEKAIYSGKFADALRTDHKTIRKICRRSVKTEGTLVHYTR